MTHARPQYPPDPRVFHDLHSNAPVIRPSPIPANAPTEQEILAEMALRQHQQQEQLRISGSASGGVQPSREDVLMMISQRRYIPEMLKTPEAISLQTAVQNGGGINMLNTFLYQFVYGQMEPARREILLQVSVI